MRRLGIDLGGTKMEAIVLAVTDQDSAGKELLRHRIPTPKESYAELLGAIHSFIDDSVTKAGEIDSVGIGLPGAISPVTGRIKNANLQILNNQDLLGDLQARLSVPVKIANDADCLALSEFRDGAAHEAEGSCFAAILGTGCGGGLVVNGTLQTGKNRIAGEWGHNPLPDYNPAIDGQGYLCYCLRGNCLETYLSGTGFSRRFNEKYQTSLSAEEIVFLYRQGDMAANHHFELFIDQLARALASVINLVDPEVIVLGGGLSNVDEIYQLVPEVWGKYIFSDTVLTTLKKARHGDSSGVRGAAWL